MASNLGFHAKAFNTKVKAMNQTGSKTLSLNADEARNLHSEIFDMLARLAEYEELSAVPRGNDVIQVVLDGDKF